MRSFKLLVPVLGLLVAQAWTLPVPEAEKQHKADTTKVLNLDWLTVKCARDCWHRTSYCYNPVGKTPKQFCHSTMAVTWGSTALSKCYSRKCSLSDSVKLMKEENAYWHEFCGEHSWNSRFASEEADHVTSIDQWAACLHGPYW